MGGKGQEPPPTHCLGLIETYLRYGLVAITLNAPMHQGEQAVRLVVSKLFRPSVNYFVQN